MPKKKEKEHEHEWTLDSITDRVYCNVCGVEVKHKVFRKCKVCGKVKYDGTELLNGYNGVEYKIDYNGSVSSHFTLHFCGNCFEKFRAKIDGFVKHLMSIAKAYDIKFIKETRYVMFENLHSLVEWVNNHIEYVSKPKEGSLRISPFEEMFGLTFYAKPKNPLESPYMVLIPYTAFLECDFHFNLIY